MVYQSRCERSSMRKNYLYLVLKGVWREIIYYLSLLCQGIVYAYAFYVCVFKVYICHNWEMWPTISTGRIGTAKAFLKYIYFLKKRTIIKLIEKDVQSVLNIVNSVHYFYNFWTLNTNISKTRSLRRVYVHTFLNPENHFIRSYHQIAPPY